jgi:protein arginine kinase activator
MPGHQPINQLISGMTSSGKPSIMAPRCEQCGASFAQIRQHGLIGCPACYDTFAEPLGRFIERAQAGATHHVGRGLQKEDEQLRQRREERQLLRALEAALSREQYERAAEIRDRIGQLSPETESNPSTPPRSEEDLA